MRITVSLPDELFKFVEREKKEQNHDNQSRVLKEALLLLKARRERRSKYEATAK